MECEEIVRLVPESLSNSNTAVNRAVFPRIQYKAGNEDLYNDFDRVYDEDGE